MVHFVNCATFTVQNIDILVDAKNLNFDKIILQHRTLFCTPFNYFRKKLECISDDAFNWVLFVFNVEYVNSWSCKIKTSLGGSPCLVVMGGDSCSEGCEFESQHRILYGYLKKIKTSFSFQIGLAVMVVVVYLPVYLQLWWFEFESC